MRPSNFAPRGNSRETNVLERSVWPWCRKSLTIFSRPICGGPAMNLRISFGERFAGVFVRVQDENPVAGGLREREIAGGGEVVDPVRKCETFAPYSPAISTVSSVEPVSATMISSATARTLCRQRARQRASFLTIMASDSFFIGRARRSIGGEFLHDDFRGVVQCRRAWTAWRRDILRRGSRWPRSGNPRRG